MCSNEAHKSKFECELTGRAQRNEMKIFPEDFKYNVWVNKQLSTLLLVKQQAFAVIIRMWQWISNWPPSDLFPAFKTIVWFGYLLIVSYLLVFQSESLAVVLWVTTNAWLLLAPFKPHLSHDDTVEDAVREQTPEFIYLTTRGYNALKCRLF